MASSGPLSPDNSKAYGSQGLILGIIFGTVTGIIIWQVTGLFVYFPIFIAAGLAIGTSLGFGLDQNEGEPQ